MAQKIKIEDLAILSSKKLALGLIAFLCSGLMVLNAWANSGNAYYDPLGNGSRTVEASYYANSPLGLHDATSCFTASGSGVSATPDANGLTTCYTGPGMRKFIDPLPLPRMPGNVAVPAAVGRKFFSGPSVLDNTPNLTGKYIPVAIPTKWVNPMGQLTGDDYYEIAAVEYKEKMHSDLVNSTLLRGYVQIDQAYTDTKAGLNNQELPIIGSQHVALFQVDGTPTMIPRPDINNVVNATHVIGADGVNYALVQAYAVDAPHYLGPLFTASRNVPTRIKFINLLPVGRATGITSSSNTATARNGDLFLPVDESLAGAGFGPDGKMKYTQNRANIHLFGGDAPWISNGGPHQWITPAGEALKSSSPQINTIADLAAATQGLDPKNYLKGASLTNVPDMPDPGPGATTYYYPNGGSARLEWYHDQSFGVARLNVYAGLAGIYMLSDPADNLANSYEANNVIPSEQIPLVFQDKTFVPRDIAVEDARWNTSIWGGEDSLWYPHVYETNQFYISNAVTTPVVTGEVTGIVDPTTKAPISPAITDPTLYSSCTNIPVNVTTTTKGQTTTTTQAGIKWNCNLVNTGSVSVTGSGMNTAGRWDWGPWFWPVFPSLYDNLPTGELKLAANTIAKQAAVSGLTDVTSTPTAYLDTPLVNGQAYPTLTVDAKPYRFRMLNAGNDRFLNLGLYLAADKLTANPIDPIQSKGQVLCDGITARPGNNVVPAVADCTEVKMVPMGSSYPSAFYDLVNNPTLQPASPDGAFAFPTSGGLLGTGWGDPSGQLAEGVPDPASMGPHLYLIGNDAGYLANMVDIPSTPVNYETNKRSITVLNVLEHGLYLGAGNRADVVVDFSKYAGKTLILYNDAPSASPAGDPRYDYLTGHGSFSDVGGVDNVQPGYGPNIRTLMQIHVSGPAPTNIPNTSAYTAALQGATAALFAADQPAPIVPQPDFAAAYPNNANIPATLTQASVMTGFICGTTTSSACTAGQNAYQGLSFKSMQTMKYLQTNNSCVTPNGSTTQNACRSAATLQTVNAGGTVSNAFFETKTIQELFEPTYGRMNSTLGLELPYTNSMIQTTIPLNYVDPLTDTVSDGVTAFWRITHNGLVDHPIHFEFVNVQIINRVGWDGTIKPAPSDEIGWKDTIITHPLEDIFVAVTAKAPNVPFGMNSSTRSMDPSQAVGIGGNGNQTNGQVVYGFTQVDPTSGNAATVVNASAKYMWEYEWRSAALGDLANDMMRPFAFDYWGDKSTKSKSTGLFDNRPDVVTGLTFLPGSGRLNWIDPTPVGTNAGPLPNPKNEMYFEISATDTNGNVTYTKTLANQTSMVVPGLSPNVYYTFKVRAHNFLADGDWSQPVTAQYVGGKDPLIVTAGNTTATSVDLIWFNVSPTNTVYNAYLLASAGTTAPAGIVAAGNLAGTLSAASTTDIASLMHITGLISGLSSGLSPNTQYWFSVVAQTSPTTTQSVPVNVTTNALGATSFTAASTGQTSASAAWVLPAQNGVIKSTITIFPATAGAKVTYSGNSAAITGLLANNSYTLTLTIAGANGVVVSTNVASITTNVSAATGLLVSGVLTNSATITWSNPAGAISQNVSLSPLGGALITKAVSNLSATLTNLTPNTTYTVTVSEVGANGLPTNASVTFTTIPGVVSNVKFTPGATAATGTFTWTNPTQTGSGSVSITLSTGAVISIAADATSAPVTGLVAGTVYTFNFQLIGAGGKGAGVPVKIFAAAIPTAKVNLISQTVATVTVTAVPGVTRYAVKTSTSSTGPFNIAASGTITTATGTINYTGTFASGSTTYFQVVPINAFPAAGVTPVEGPASATQSISITTPTAAVTNFAATSPATGKVNLTWANPASNTNVSGFVIQKRTGTLSGLTFTANGTWTSITQTPAAVAGNGTSYVDTATKGITYQYQIAPSNAAGSGPAATVVIKVN